jgi:hypothetical protein
LTGRVTYTISLLVHCNAIVPLDMHNGDFFSVTTINVSLIG